MQGSVCVCLDRSRARRGVSPARLLRRAFSPSRRFRRAISPPRRIRRAMPPKAKKSGRYAVGQRVGQADPRITVKQSKKLRAELEEFKRENERMQHEIHSLHDTIEQLRKQLKQYRKGLPAEEHDEDQRPHIKKAWRALRA